MRTNGLHRIVLFAAAVSLAAAVVLFALDGRVDGAGWFGLGIGVGGLALLGLWWRSVRRPVLREPVTPSKPPGAWYFVALCGIVILQVVWFMVWRKV